MSRIITDSEYTTWPGALESGWAEAWQHREIFQMGAIEVDENFGEIKVFNQLVIPTINSKLSDLSQELTGISQEQLAESGISFPQALERFAAFCGADPEIICMSGDCGVVRENCKLNHLQFPFEHDYRRLRPLLEKLGVNLRTHSSGDLHKLTPAPLEGQTHDAVHDCRSMAHWFKYARENGLFVSLDQLPRGIPLVDPRTRDANTGK